MKAYISTGAAIRALVDDEYSDLTYEGAEAIVDDLEQIEQDQDVDITFDIVAIRCEYSQYRSAHEAAKAYDFTDRDEQRCLDFLHNSTTVFELDNDGVVIADF